MAKPQRAACESGGQDGMANWRIDDLAMDQVSIIEADTQEAAVQAYLECRESNLLVCPATDVDVANFGRD